VRKEEKKKKERETDVKRERQINQLLLTEDPASTPLESLQFRT